MAGKVLNINVCSPFKLHNGSTGKCHAICHIFLYATLAASYPTNKLIVMKIRATKKLLNTSKVKPISDSNDSVSDLPGEWYANLVSLNSPGKLAIHFLHNPTYISIIVPTKSLNKALLELPHRIENLLFRHGYSKMINAFHLDSENKIYKTNNRSMLGYLNNMKYDIEYQFSRFMAIESIDYQKIEDLEMEYLFGGKYINGFVDPKSNLNELMNASS
jgi:hypothetical protein